MQTGQVSVWVPIVVGVIGLTGVVVGQLINTAREDRRWQREREREELRWQREQEKDARGKDHEYDKYWIDRKVEVYAHFLQAAAEWAKSASMLALFGEHLKLEDAFAAADKQLAETASQVEIFGSAELITLAANLKAVHLDYFFLIVNSEPMPESARRRMAEQLADEGRVIVKQVRDELRITRPVTDLPIEEMKE